MKRTFKMLCLMLVLVTSWLCSTMASTMESDIFCTDQHEQSTSTKSHQAHHTTCPECGQHGVSASKIATTTFDGRILSQQTSLIFDLQHDFFRSYLSSSIYRPPTS